MKKLIYTVLAGCWMSAPCLAGTWVDVNLLGGVKTLSNTDWGSNDTHGAVGVEAVASPPLLPLSFTGGFLHTGDSSNGPREKLKAETQEIWLGIGKKIDLPLVHFLVSGGPVFIRARQDQSSTLSAPMNTDRDNGFGYYVSGSAFVQVLGHLNLGAQIRYSAAKTEVNNRDIKAGGVTYLGLVGFGF